MDTLKHALNKLELLDDILRDDMHTLATCYLSSKDTMDLTKITMRRFELCKDGITHNDMACMDYHVSRRIFENSIKEIDPQAHVYTCLIMGYMDYYFDCLDDRMYSQNSAQN